MAYPSYETYRLTSDRAVISLDWSVNYTHISIAVDQSFGSGKAGTQASIMLSKAEVAELAKKLSDGLGE